MTKKKEITNANVLEFLQKRVALKDDLKDFATKSDLTQFKSEILTSVDKVMKELQDHRAEDKSTFQLFVELRARQDRRDKAFAKVLKINLSEIDNKA